MTKQKAVAELLLAGAIWGFGFVATIWGVQEMAPFTFTAFRFTLAFLIFFGIMKLLGRKREMTEHFLLSMWPGLLLGISLLLQTLGLKYTTATKSGFITTLYIVIIPVCEWFLYKKKFTVLNFFMLLLALWGVVLLTGFRGGALNVGDVVTLICSFTFAAQILVVDKVIPKIKSGFAFNGCQTFWAAIPSWALTLALDPFPSMPTSFRFYFSFLFMVCASSLFAFMLQIRAQKVLVPFVASMLFLLEAPYSAFFAWPLLGEVMTHEQWIGAIMILFSAVGVSLLQRK